MQGHLEQIVDIRVPLHSALLESAWEFLGEVAGRNIVHFFVFDGESRAHKNHAHVVSHIMVRRYQSLS